MLKSRPLLLAALDSLKSSDAQTRSNSAKQVRACVMAELRDGTTESFSKYLTELNRRVFELVSSSDPVSKWFMHAIPPIIFFINISSLFFFHLSLVFNFFIFRVEK